MVYEYWRHLPQGLYREVRQELEHILTKGIIKSQSRWHSPLVIVPQPGGTLRLCVDFRKVNYIAKFEAFPIPRVEKMVEKIGQAKYISTLDMTKSYWQIPMANKNCERMAFRTPWGLFEFQ